MVYLLACLFVCFERRLEKEVSEGSGKPEKVLREICQV